MHGCCFTGVIPVYLFQQFHRAVVVNIVKIGTTDSIVIVCSSMNATDCSSVNVGRSLSFLTLSERVHRSVEILAFSFTLIPPGATENGT